jgi:spore germination protein YaaH
VAEYSWVETSLKKIFDLIPREKLILAVPFYTRVWTLEGDKISSQAISMEGANKFIENNKIELIWDENAAQYFGEINKANKLMKIWLEDAKSLEYKASLINKYDLAGIASWRKGFETQDVWTSLSRVFE